jgi:hypothetical protein
MLVLSCHVGVMLYKDPRKVKVHMAPFGGPMQRSSLLVLGCRVRAFLNEETREIHVTPLECPVKWSPSMLVLSRCIGTVLDEQPRNIHMTAF